MDALSGWAAFRLTDGGVWYVRAAAITMVGEHQSTVITESIPGLPAPPKPLDFCDVSVCGGVPVLGGTTMFGKDRLVVGELADIMESIRQAEGGEAEAAWLPLRLSFGGAVRVRASAVEAIEAAARPARAAWSEPPSDHAAHSDHAVLSLTGGAIVRIWATPAQVLELLQRRADASAATRPGT